MLRILALIVMSCGVARAAEMPLVLLQSPATAAFFKNTKTSYEDDLLVPWRSFFRRNKVAVREAKAGELASIQGKAVLIIPSAVVLSDAERKAISTRVAAGWSVLGTWALGTRDEKGATRGYGFLEELFGVKVVYDKPPEGEFRFFLPYGETPLTHRLRAGQRMYFRASGEGPLRLRTDHGAGRISDYNRDVSQSHLVMPVAAFDERGGSRRAYIGAPESSWDSAQAEMDAFLFGTLDWLKRKPIVFKSAWPEAYEAALLLEMDTEDKFANGTNFATQLEKAGLRGTFFCLTSEAVKNPSALKRIAEKHEIAYHADVHTGFRKVDEAKQDERMKAMVKQLAPLLPSGMKPTGFRPPLEEYDATTEKLLRPNGLAYMAGSNDTSDDTLPKFSKVDPELVLLPRTWADDIVLLRAGKLDTASTDRILLASLETTLAGRGFGLLSIHSQYFESGGALQKAMPILLQALAQRRSRLWIAPADTIARWWRDQAAVHVTSRADAQGDRVTLDVARSGISGVKLVVIGPAPGKAPTIEGLQGAQVRKLDDQRWAVLLPEL
ncbi:MAG: polysaccharide deacetylase family protein, partial [Betaproteobacteria bacterium]|nr:polysaccharide deacetylase family protein [Betaproteobacteria bacterium]MBV9360633.1 polysaccharide deacetylase family protein [Betaproteobacteria bacterium]